MPQAPKNLRHFKSLVDVVEALRGPNGCPWDKEQTHQSLTQYAIEEAHELAEAIDKNQQDAIVEELGDLLLQVVLHSEIAKQENRFDIEDVIESISSKMIRRHPHVFADVKVKDSDEVLDNWATIKASEKERSGKDAKKFFDIPSSLPALIRAQKIGAKTRKYRFDWDKVEQVVGKVEEELTELKDAIAHKDMREQQMELGDLLFSVTQLARHLSFDAEQALRQTNQRFENRFEKMHELCLADGKVFSDLDAAQLEILWQQAKKEV